MSETESGNASGDNGNSPSDTKDANMQTDENDNKPIESVVNEKTDSHVKKEIGEYATPIDTSPKSSDLLIGNLQIGDDSKDLKKYGKLVVRDRNLILCNEEHRTNAFNSC
jgi:hypothetical protein